MNITFRQIDAFRTVVSTGTVTESAHILGISQPAVSRLLSDLEKEVDFKLFNRNGRNLKPTLEAQLLAEEVRRALSGLERIKEVARSIRQFQHAQLRIITTPAFASPLGTKLVKRFSERRPEVMISLEIQSTDDTIEWMVSQNHDFGIASPSEKNPTLLSQPLLKSKAVCIVPKNHPLASKRKLVAADLVDQSFISYLPDSVFRFEIDEIFRNAQVDRQLRYEARTSEAIRRLVSDGLGVSIVGSVDSAQQDELGILAIPFKPSLPFHASLIWSRQKTMSAVAEDFLTMLETGRSPEPA